MEKILLRTGQKKPKQAFEDPCLRLIVFEMKDVLTTSPLMDGEEDPNAGTWMP